MPLRGADTESRLKSRERQRLPARQRLLDAFSRIQRGTPEKVTIGRRLSVSLFAREAGVNRVTVYDYPDVLEKFKRFARKFATGVSEDVQSEPRATREKPKKMKKLRELASQLQKDKDLLLKRNYVLVRENERLRELVTRAGYGPL